MYKYLLVGFILLYFYWQGTVSGWKMVINTLTRCADRVIIRLILCVVLRTSKTSSYLSEKNNSMRRNFRQYSNFSKCWKNGWVRGKKKKLASHKEPPDLISWMCQNVAPWHIAKERKMKKRYYLLIEWQ